MLWPLHYDPVTPHSPPGLCIPDQMRLMLPLLEKVLEAGAQGEREKVLRCATFKVQRMKRKRDAEVN